MLIAVKVARFPLRGDRASGILGVIVAEDTCLPCAVGYHHECWRPAESGLCHCADEPVALEREPMAPSDRGEKKERGGQIKDASDVEDLQSTGRKRAAKLFPIPKEGEPGYPMACEWQGLAKAGGGVEPIIGCIQGLATNIHHGPDKNTLSNYLGNLHRICATCHNRWHAKNDKYYAGERPKGDVPYVPLGEYVSVPHDYITKATPNDLALNEVEWLKR